MILPKRGAFSYFDYSQIEPRLFGYFTAKLGDTSIADWYREGRDVYVEIAARALKKPAEAITESERQHGKVWFLMSLYGAGPKKVSEELEIPLGEAKKFYADFHEGLPQIRLMSNPTPRGGAHPNYEPGAIERIYAQRGHLKTPWGRHLHAEQWGEFKLLNKLIQGSAADLMKQALLKVDAWVQSADIESRMVLVIHDEIVFDGPESELPILHEHVPALMSDFPAITAVIPISVDHEVSTTSWADKVDYDEWKESFCPSSP